MNKVNKLTKEMVFEAINQLKLENKKVTQSAIRNLFGGVGSNTTISKYIKAYQVEHGETVVVRIRG